MPRNSRYFKKEPSYILNNLPINELQNDVIPIDLIGIPYIAKNNIFYNFKK